MNPDYARSHDHLIPIFIAAASGHLACCQVLIENGADAARRMWCTSEGYRKNVAVSTMQHL